MTTLPNPLLSVSSASIQGLIVTHQPSKQRLIARGLLAAASILIWMLLILLPSMNAINDLEHLTLHFPPVVTGLGLLVGIMAAYSLKADGHLVWFTLTLCLLAGWI